MLQVLNFIFITIWGGLVFFYCKSIKFLFDNLVNKFIIIRTLTNISNINSVNNRNKFSFFCYSQFFSIIIFLIVSASSCRFSSKEIPKEKIIIKTTDSGSSVKLLGNMDDSDKKFTEKLNEEGNSSTGLTKSNSIVNKIPKKEKKKIISKKIKTTNTYKKKITTKEKKGITIKKSNSQNITEKNSIKIEQKQIKNFVTSANKKKSNFLKRWIKKLKTKIKPFKDFTYLKLKGLSMFMKRIGNMIKNKIKGWPIFIIALIIGILVSLTLLNVFSGVIFAIILAFVAGLASLRLLKKIKTETLKIDGSKKGKVFELILFIVSVLVFFGVVLSSLGVVAGTFGAIILAVIAGAASWRLVRLLGEGKL